MNSTLSTDPLSFLNHNGELAALIREFDWEKTALGPAGGWSAHIKTLTSLALLSKPSSREMLARKVRQVMAKKIMNR